MTERLFDLCANAYSHQQIGGVRSPLSLPFQVAGAVLVEPGTREKTTWRWAPIYSNVANDCEGPAQMEWQHPLIDMSLVDALQSRAHELWSRFFSIRAEEGAKETPATPKKKVLAKKSKKAAKRDEATGSLFALTGEEEKP